MDNLEKQYWAIKEKFPGSILMFRIGDFYEMFFEDATVVARTLDLEISVRGFKIPFCKIRCSDIGQYIDELQEAGYVVSLLEEEGGESINGKEI